MTISTTNSKVISDNRVIGVWKSFDYSPASGVAFIFLRNNEFKQFNYHNKDEQFKSKPNSIMWTGFGKWSLQGHVLKINITSSSSNTKHSYTFIIKSLLQKKLVVLDKSDNKIYHFVKN